jgi:hypothetical protein
LSPFGAAVRLPHRPFWTTTRALGLVEGAVCGADELVRATSDDRRISCHPEAYGKEKRSFLVGRNDAPWRRAKPEGRFSLRQQ